MTSRQAEQGRTASESVSLPALTAQALAALQAAGLDFEGLELNAGFRRKPRHDHLWCVADTGVGRNGQPWLMVTAGNAKVTGDVSTLLVVYKSWETVGATIDPAESAERQRQIEQTARRRREEDKARREAAAQQARALWSTASAQINGHPAATLTTAGGWPDGSTAAKGSVLMASRRPSTASPSGWSWKPMRRVESVSPGVTRRRASKRSTTGIRTRTFCSVSRFP